MCRPFFPGISMTKIFVYHMHETAAVLPQIFFNLTTLLSYPVFLCLCHAPLDVVVHSLYFLFTSLYFSDPSGSNSFFLSSLLLSHKSRISAVTQGFVFWRCLPRISLAVLVTAVLKVVIIEADRLLFMVTGNWKIQEINLRQVETALGQVETTATVLTINHRVFEYFCICSETCPFLFGQNS